MEGRRRLHLALHLVRRFFGALSPKGPPASDEAWVAKVLGAGSATHELWSSMSGADRRHAVEVARRVSGRLGEGVGPDVLAAALLHDVGKVESGLGTIGRVPATLVGLAGGRSRAPSWSVDPRFSIRRRFGQYLSHGDQGARLLGAVGAPTLAVAWAADHHRPITSWTVPVGTGEILKEADDD